MSHLDELDVLDDFYRDVIRESGVRILRLKPTEIQKITDIQRRFSLDFDDSYQYIAAKEHGLKLVSFDGDFDSTDMNRSTPKDLMSG